MDLAQATAAVAVPMTAAATTAVLDLLFTGTLAPDAGAGLLISWQRRGPTGTELAATVEALLARAVRPPIAGPVIDLCGTGGSGRTRFNVSTTAACVLAAAGIPVAKHGNRGSARPNGSFDLLDALGVPFHLPPERIAAAFAASGLCFLFARQMHPAVATVAPYRKAAVGQVPRTIFNLAGPLANPCRPACQLIGVADPATAAIIAEAAHLLGVRRTCIVAGHPGIDEASITGPTQVWEAGAPARTIDASRPTVTGLDLPGGDAPENARLCTDLLAGSGHQGLAAHVALNAGIAIDCWHGRPASADGPGVRQAAALLASGAAGEALVRYRAAAS
jgi:anthranilate phosphoribosyltransferase